MQLTPLDGWLMHEARWIDHAAGGVANQLLCRGLDYCGPAHIGKYINTPLSTCTQWLLATEWSGSLFAASERVTSFTAMSAITKDSFLQEGS